MPEFTEQKMTDRFWGHTQQRQPVAPAVQHAGAPAEIKVVREFNAATYGRIVSSLDNDTRHIMTIMRYQGRTLRARSRQLVDNNPYAAKLCSMAEVNICGPDPFRLQAKIRNSRGKFDDFANNRIENSWQLFGESEFFDFTGRLSRADFVRLLVRTWFTDGEALVRVWEGSEIGPWGIKVQLLDTDRLDEDRNENLSNGNTIVAGVELDIYGRTVAYHFLKSKPSDWTIGRYTREYVRIPIEQIIHVFKPNRAEQVRGLPWLFAVLINLHHLGKFDEAAIIAARVGASKMGFYKTTNGIPPAGDSLDSKGNFVQDAEPGVFDVLPDGYDFVPFDPAYPDAMVADFKKAMLRSIAVGSNVSYHMFNSDLESVNFSSARIGLLEERDCWVMLQNILIDQFFQPLYRRWLAMANLTGQLTVQGPISKFWSVKFCGRRWQWIDPLKEVQANLMAVEGRLTSRSQIVGDSGNDLEDIFNELAAEQAMAADKGIELEPVKKPQPVQSTEGGSDANQNQ